MVEPKVVREQVRDTPLEAVELGERVVAERQQDAHAQSGAGHELGQLARETGLLAVVEEVLLGLVEDEQQVAGKRLGPAAKGVRKRLALVLVEQRGTELVGQRVAHSLREALPTGSSLHCVEDDDDELRMTAFLDVLPRLLLVDGERPPRASTELLPTPLGPYSTVSREARTFALMIPLSRSRPKNSSASSSLSSNGTRPL